MMKKSMLLLLVFLSFISRGQVGIGVENPTRTVDVNGNMRVRGINVAGGVTTKDSVMTIDGKGVFKYVSSSKIMEQVPAGTFPMQKTNFFTGTGTTANFLGIANLSATSGQVIGWTGSAWSPITQVSSSNWSFVGNSNTLSTNYLGTNTDIAMNIRSNNVTMLSFGRRTTLGLFDNSNTGLYPYNQADNAVAYIRGTSGNAAMQFESENSLKYKPVFYSSSDGNFGFRGSAAGNDWFEVASAGTSNNGSLGFTIGDDGIEPIVFRKYNKDTGTYVELMRMQGTGLTTDVRVGINTNGITANSTFEVKGSISKSVKPTNTATVTLGELDYTSVLGTLVTQVALPTASTCKGRIYIIKKANTQSVTISSYQNRTNVSSTALLQGVTQVQSDGTNWQQIN